MRTWVAWLVLAVGLATALAQAAAPPARPTPAQQAALRQAAAVFARADALGNKGDLPGFIEQGLRGLELERAVLGQTRTGRLVWVRVLAWMLEGRGDFARAGKLRDEALAVLAAAHGPDHWLAVDARLDAADCRLLARLTPAQRGQLRQADDLNREFARLWPSGRLKEALPIAERALRLRRPVLGERHRDVALSVFNLAALHAELQQFPQAERLYRQALALTKEAVGRRHPAYADCLNNLASLYHDMGDLEAALTLSLEALQLRRELVGSSDPSYARSLSNLSVLYTDLGRLDAALPLAREALKVRKEALGERHPDYAQSLLNVAHLHRVHGEYQTALTLFREALKLNKEVVGTHHPTYAHNVYSLAMLHRDMGDYRTALSLGEEALALRKAALGPRHPACAQSLDDLAWLHRQTGERGKAAALYGQALEVWRLHLEDNLAGFSQRQRADRLDQLAGVLDSYLSTSLGSASAADLYESALVYKGLSASRSAEERLALRQPRLAPLLAGLRLARADLARHAVGPPSKEAVAGWKKHFDALERRKEALEVQLAQASEAFRQSRQKPTAAAVSAALPDGAALVEFLVYSHEKPAKGRKGKEDSERRLLAWVLRKGQAPVLVRLGAAGPIEAAVRTWRQAALDGQPRGQTKDARPVRTRGDAAALLRRLVWLPVSRHLGGAKLVLLSPDGELAGLPFATLPGRKFGSYLVEEVAFAHLTSGRQLLLQTPPDPRAKGLLAVGGADFSKAPPRPPRTAARAWPALPGSEREARPVAALFTGAFPRAGRPRLLEGTNADRPTLLAALRPPPAWLHLATHAFFDPPPQAPARRQGAAGEMRLDEVVWRTFGRNPLLASGLVLAGANESAERGLLTAEEVAGLDLSGVRLAALSACQTALGQQAGWQGVQGLQRAFHEAGAQHLLASLWSVHDAATSVLMEEFYEQLWAKKQPPAEALRRAQLAVLTGPDRVLRRVRELRAELARRGIPEHALAARGLGKQAVALPRGGQTPAARSPVAWWGAWVLSGQ
jgi:CHAT domain-containing protein/Tfp pilus assembly protein PilF